MCFYFVPRTSIPQSKFSLAKCLKAKRPSQNLLRPSPFCLKERNENKKGVLTNYEQDSLSEMMNSDIPGCLCSAGEMK